MKERTKERKWTIKKPVAEVEHSICDRIQQTLENDKKNAYTITGLMIETLRVNARDIDGSFSDWKEGLPTLYTRTRLCLEKLVKAGKAKKAKSGKAYFYWWVA